MLMAIIQDNEDMEAEEEVPLVTKAMIKAWKKAVTDSKSLRSARKILLAFKAAVQEGETEHEDQEPLKYRIEDSAGMYRFERC
jgi:hypothetical protein